MLFISAWPEMSRVTDELLASPSPVFLNRVGGSDTNAVAALLEARDAGRPDDCPEVMDHLRIVQRYNGYYDLDQDRAKYFRYLNLLLSSYDQSTYLSFCNSQLISLYFPSTIREAKTDFPGRRGFELLVDRITALGHGKAYVPYGFIENLTYHPFTLFHVFSNRLQGKKVLVISPFAESIAANFHNRHKFFKKYQYPDFEVELCDTPITYSGLPAEFYPDRDWFETVAALERKVAGIEFDIALLSCGSYAVPLGDFICKSLNRKAVYVGGLLQLFFGITGRRYVDNKFFMDQINAEYFIFPVEGQKYLEHVKISPQMAREAFGAYF